MPLAAKFPTYSVPDLLETARDGCSFAQILLDGKEKIFNRLSQMEETVVLSVTLTRLSGDANVGSLNVNFSVADSFLCNCISQHLHGNKCHFRGEKDKPPSVYFKWQVSNIICICEPTRLPSLEIEANKTRHITKYLPSFALVLTSSLSR
jgi:hypothetical protein